MEQPSDETGGLQLVLEGVPHELRDAFLASAVLRANLERCFVQDVVQDTVVRLLEQARNDPLLDPKAKVLVDYLIPVLSRELPYTPTVDEGDEKVYPAENLDEEGDPDAQPGSDAPGDPGAAV